MDQHGSGAKCKEILSQHTTRDNEANPRLDATIQAEVWLAFWQAEDTRALDTSAMDVAVRQCEVWLSGEVGEVSEKDLAECLVKSISGVADCHNELKTKNSQP